MVHDGGLLEVVDLDGGGGVLDDLGGGAEVDDEGRREGLLQGHGLTLREGRKSALDAGRVPVVVGRRKSEPLRLAVVGPVGVPPHSKVGPAAHCHQGGYQEEALHGGFRCG